MGKSKVERTEQQRQVRIIAPDDFSGVPYIYANQVGCSITPDDITLHFADYMIPQPGKAPDGGDLEVMARPLMSIALPPRQAQVLLDVLTNSLGNWKENFREGLMADPDPTDTEEASG